jgi:hypothetical protein
MELYLSMIFWLPLRVEWLLPLRRQEVLLLLLPLLL